MATITCTDCGIELVPPPPPLCPSCGSVRRTAHVSGGATARAHASGEASAELCRPRGTSNRKRRAFGYQHSEYSRDGSGRRVWKHWEIDKDLDRYVERVVDLETGDVLIDKVERLTDHRGFGSARFGAEGGPDE